MYRFPPLLLAVVCSACYSPTDRNPFDSTAIGTEGSGSEGGEAGEAGGGGGDDAGDHPAAACDDVDPGSVVLHRLNRAEYDNTVRDLLGVDLALADGFPAESHVEGFDNNAQALTFSPLHAEKYFAAAKDAVAATLDDAQLSETLVFCEPVGDDVRGCAEPVFREFLPRAYRRPATDAEVDRMVALVEDAIGSGETFEEGISEALTATLISPNFLYRPEPAPQDAAPGEAYRLPPYALASRLSYFLWSSMPDDALFEAAESGALADHDEIANQVRRMLADEKADAFTRNFVGQWLHARAMEEARPDASRFPAFDESLRTAMEEEAYAFFAKVLAEDRPLSDFLLADFVVVNRRLAEHYGLPSDGLGDEFEPVELGNETRGGVLGQASFLTVTSHPTRTSPVKRGKWVIEQLLCTSPPPPPPGVEQLPEDVDPDATQREIFEQHRADPACSSCHALMDPIGFALEGYDAIGATRTSENGSLIETQGELSGVEFDDAAELAQILAEDSRYLPCVTKKVFTYAVGRAPDDRDECTVEAIAQALEGSDQSIVELLILIAQSPAGTQRTLEG